MAADWEAFEDALFDLVKLATSFTDAQIVWENQSVDHARPTGQHASINVIADDPVSDGEVTNTYDEDADEIVTELRETRDVTVRFTVFGGLTTANVSARSLASKIQTELATQRTMGALSLVGASCFDRGRVNHAPAIVDADFEPRAFFEARFYVSDGVTETNTLIESVEIENTSTEETFVVP